MDEVLVITLTKADEENSRNAIPVEIYEANQNFFPPNG